MTVLSVAQDISTVLGFERPSAVMSSTEQTGYELAALANECGQQLAECYPWQKLKRLATITGDGTTTEFDLPDDFGWMPLGQQLRTSTLGGALEPIMDHDRWLELTLQAQASSTFGSWTKLGDQIVFYPARSDDEEVNYYYVTNLWALDAAEGEPQNGFLLDEDEFRLPERLLRFCMIWKWKAYHGQPYAEEMQTFEIELAKYVMRDRGPRMIAIGMGGEPLSRGYGAASASGISTSTAFPYTLPFSLA
jgi:hypothetical protein